ncbi:MAG: hypothetical protein Q7S05_04465 [bacterium]|nr:hypothetical protein [bacterium]
MNSEQRAKTSVRDMYAYRHEPERMREFAEFYWRVLLLVASVMVILVITFGIMEASAVLELRGVSEGGGGISQPIPKLDKAKLKNTLYEFQSRQERFESLKAQPPEIKDPSQ